MNFYKKNMKFYGESAQLDKLQEECFELAEAISELEDFERLYGIDGSGENINHICEEMADVEIMIKQFRTLKPYRIRINWWRKYKIKRQRGRWSE